TPLASVTWFGVGGPAEVLFRPADRDDLIAFLAAKPAEVPATVIGVGSNLLVRDGGVPGVVIRFGRALGAIEAPLDPGGTELVCEAGALDVNVAKAAAKAGIGGLEFLRGVPGTIGGALRMNAGAYGREIKDVLVWAEALDPQGQVHRLGPADMGFSYRRSALAEDWIFLAACLAGRADDPAAIRARMREIQEARLESQPIGSRTGGSTFKNPPSEVGGGRTAWQLIDAAGCRGLELGGAQVSEMHCNFLINKGAASAADLEGLGEEVRRRVLAETGVRLDWEIRRIGLHAEPALAAREGET
ncbi:MAG: UDP-N-acetylmuramate dehydrogenase, partial [Kiloniellales bacterium]|nr:UDP-N-acetylmuramate dehydrogenase [Kiloniellales bacterium]